MLRGSLYEILSEHRCFSEAAFRVRLLEDCEVYKAHFPGKPITPGAALVRIAEELSALFLGREVFIKAVKEAKFLSVITPPAEPEFRFRRVQDVRGRTAVEVTVFAAETLCARMSLLLPHICAIVPSYNNVSTVLDVVSGVKEYIDDVIVVCDGCTDGTESVLRASGLSLNIVSYTENKGKGAALKAGFREAGKDCYDHALTIDSDGQHFPEDIPQVLAALTDNPGAVIIGSRNLSSDGMPVGNTFANRFSNFWFRVQTGVSLPDTQTGFRLYPLAALPPLSLLTPRYESELEILVLMAWKGIRIEPVPVRVVYPEGRVSHFRPVRDFVRISVLNVVLCILAVFYGYPRRLASHI